MTSISATTGYTSYSTTTTAPSANAGATGGSASSVTTTSSQSASATNITLSEAAKAALAAPDFASVIASARAALDALFIDGKEPADIDLGKLDRRQLFAVSSNAGGNFTSDEQAAAKAEQQDRLDAALAGPLAVARVTDDVEGIYTAALAWLDGASAEEKSTPAWTSQRGALIEARKQLAADPSKTPDVEGDVVAAYIERMTAGDDPDTPRDFDAVASDARAALDAQYAAARADGKTLTFNGLQKNGQAVDFSQFDSRSLSAVALNQDARFTPEEVFAARQVISQRSSSTILAGLKSAANDPASFARNLISAYGSMSPEERTAAGWSDQLYSAAVASYNTAAQLANIFGDAGSANGSGSALTLLDAINAQDSSADSPSMSLASALGSSG